MGAPRWRGHRDLEPGKVHYEDVVGKSTIRTEYHGPYSVCLSRKPALGMTITGFGDAFRVTSRKIEELDGDAGRIEITLEAQTDEGTVSFGGPIGEPTYEIEWVEIQRPIEMHRRCGVLKAARFKWNKGVKQADAAVTTEGERHTWDDWAELDADDYDATGSTGVDGMSKWTLAEYKSTKAAGTDSYILAQPILRRTLIYMKPPTGLGAAVGKITAAPEGIRPGGYSYLGGPDRCTKQGRTYTRTTEWHGAESWSTLIYPVYAGPAI